MLSVYQSAFQPSPLVTTKGKRKWTLFMPLCAYMYIMLCVFVILSLLFYSLYLYLLVHARKHSCEEDCNFLPMYTVWRNNNKEYQIFNLWATKMTGAEVSFRDSVRVELLFLRVRRSQLRGSQIPHWGGVPWHVKSGGDPVADLRHAGDWISLAFGIPPEEVLEVPGETSA